MFDEKVVRLRQLGVTRTHLVTGILCFVFGGAVGGALVMHTASHQGKTHQQELQRLLDEQSSMASKNHDLAAKLETQQASSDALGEQSTQLEQSLATLKKQNAQLTKHNKQLTGEVSSLKKTISSLQTASLEQQHQNQALQGTVDKQNHILTQSKEYFQGQLKLQQQIHDLNAQREKLIVTFNNLVKECQVYTDGKSWDAKSDSCERKQKASDRLKAIDKSINLKQSQMDSLGNEAK
ncbi:hypothetical protein [Vibrio ezurae]|uniref:Uncharacterized protein n=1 Tax=Vibrio ezurae NBRC 102218 TaxID=1219080 RepID=U3AZR9_9VIBR|nr:hypothetical protein [Vibrio ezurae]GAD79225.1 hypothetical protein VEZ01S_08_02610 [Vibrio ezurae NBRC 102218]